MNRWKIGDATVTRFVEMETVSKATFILPQATPENVLTERSWLVPNFAEENGKVRMSIHALVVESKGLRMVVDTCLGNDKRRDFPGWNELHTPFLQDLEAGGFARDSITHVLCTHLHVDHVGWNTMLIDGRWVPTFPKARYLIGRKEWEHWSVSNDRQRRDPIEDSVRPIVDAGLADPIESDRKITDEIRLEPTPGHTPGHFSVRISSRGQDAIITGDLMHHPIQCAHPEWASSADSEPEQALRTRRAFLERYSDSPVLVLGTHFATPSAGHIVKHGPAWRFRV